jgi:hypothetical protein
MDKIDWNITGQNNIRMKFVIPVGKKLSKEESDKLIAELRGIYHENDYLWLLEQERKYLKEERVKKLNKLNENKIW